MTLRALLNITSFLPLTDAGALQILFIVFAALSAILLVFIILLFASEKFRALFFKPAKKTKKKTSGNKKQTQPVEDDAQQTEAPAKKSADTARVRLAYSDSVPTVPLSAPIATNRPNGNASRGTSSAKLTMTLRSTPAKTTYGNSLDHVPTVVLTPKSGSGTVTDGNTYIAAPRSTSKTNQPKQTTATTTAKKSTTGTTTKPLLKFVAKPAATDQTSSAAKTAAKTPTASTTAKTPTKTSTASKTAAKTSSAATTTTNGRNGANKK